ncbi:MAG: DUF4430 domain-containing protein [Blautia sp.]|nr:DUF4430 domain-containing protein [Lachnoclostridium sp.]MCM1211938.1 DUF4430 domain-containing protein [Blautia sp.]
MRKKYDSKLWSFIFCMGLLVVMALAVTGCNGSRESGASARDGQEAGVVAEGDPQGEYQQLGEGSTVFFFTVVDKEGTETKFEIHTDKETVGEALLALGLIAGDESEYGLYVKTVNGITADYDADGVYWAFYIDGEYAQTGVDSASITEGASYSFKVE